MASMYSIFRRILRETLEDGFFMDGGGAVGALWPRYAPPCALLCARLRLRAYGARIPCVGGALPPICKGQAYRPLRGR